MPNRKHGATRTAPKAGNVYQQCVTCHAERLVEKDGQPLKVAGKWSARWCMSVGEAEGKTFANCEHQWPEDSPPSTKDACIKCGAVYADIVTITDKDLVILDNRPLDVMAETPKLIDREYDFTHRANCHCTTDDRPYVCRQCWAHQARGKGTHAPDCLDCDNVTYLHKGLYPVSPQARYHVVTDEELAYCDTIARRRQALAEEKQADESKSVGEKSGQAHRLHTLGVMAKYIWHRLRGREPDEIALMLIEPFTKDGHITQGVDDVLPPGQTLVVRGRTAVKGEKTRLTMPIDKGRDITADFVVLVEFTPRSRRVGVMGYTRRDMWIDWREAVDIRHGRPPKTTPTWVYRGPMLDLGDLLELCGIELPSKDLGGVL